MTNINQAVWKLISQDFSVQKNLKKGLINVRALAKYLIKKHHLRASLDSVISAIRRYESEKKFTEMSEELSDIFKESMIFTKNNIVCITVKADAIIDVLKDPGIEEIKKNFRVVRSKKYSKIVVDQEDLEKVTTLLKKEDVVSIKERMGELRIVLTRGSEDMKGILARITGEIALHEVSISEIIICFPEFLIYVDQDNLLTAHRAILSLSESE
jgi:hypothetical protein